MDRVKLSRIDEELDSSEVAALCFLCRELVNKKRLEKVHDAKDLFLRLEERGLLDDGAFLSQLLHTIGRADLLSLLETDSRRPEEIDAIPLLSTYSVMLYEIHMDLTQENFEKMKFLLDGGGDCKLDKRQLELCKTSLDVFAEMERKGFLSKQKLHSLHKILLQLDRELVKKVERYMQGLTQPAVPPHVSMDYQRDNNSLTPNQLSLPVSETQPINENGSVFSDSDPHTEPPSLPDQTEYYPLTHRPLGQCVIFNNEVFQAGLGRRGGSDKDEEALRHLFSRLGFTVVVHSNLTADDMIKEVNELSRRNFIRDDILVMCVLSHGEKGVVFGTDEMEVPIRKLTFPFTSGQAPTLIGKPKLFFIQACQGSGYQGGAIPITLRQTQEEERQQSRLEEDAGVPSEVSVPHDADFLLGMATVEDYKSFRHTTTGSIYIQELCRQLHRAASSSEMDDLLSVLTRVNREVSKGVYLKYKQMPEPKYTLTKKLVLKYV